LSQLRRRRIASHQPSPISAVNSPHSTVGTFDRPLASPASPRPAAPSPGSVCGLPPAVGLVGGGVAAVAVCPGARVDTTISRWLAEYFGLQVVSVSVGVGVGSRTSTWSGLTTWVVTTL